jgi:uncharacterized membrane-anchored protein YhcB (DUF1043 family)|tara:strand:+ start:415 stop:720 length:306 start_codon:yes stop_codon:yes gene_type:complete
MSEIKFTEEELKRLQDLSQLYRDLQQVMGQVSVQKLLNQQQADRIEAQELDLIKQYEDNQKNEREFTKELNEKYGPGQLDPQSGIFTPAPKQESTEIEADK